MSNESSIIRAGVSESVPRHIQTRRAAMMEQDMSDTAFRQEQAIKKNKIGDATAVASKLNDFL